MQRINLFTFYQLKVFHYFYQYNLHISYIICELSQFNKAE